MTRLISTGIGFVIGIYMTNLMTVIVGIFVGIYAAQNYQLPDLHNIGKKFYELAHTWEVNNRKSKSIIVNVDIEPE